MDFSIKGKEDKLRVYTTRCDTLFGVTYMVVSPEHPIIDKYKDELKNWDEIAAYRDEAAKKSDFERAELAKDKTGVQIEGLTAINPVNGKEIPIWISDYVLMSYGTGAIMAVPAHDERDWEFAKKFNLPINSGRCKERRGSRHQCGCIYRCGNRCSDQFGFLKRT